MSKDLSAEWLEEEDVIEEEESVFTGGSESPFITGYGVYDVKVTMAKLVKIDKKKVQFIEVDFVNKDGKTHTESFMIKGKDGKSFFIGRQAHNKGKKVQHFGVNKIKSLIKVAGLYPEEPSTKLMASLFTNTEDADVTFNKFGQEKTEEFTIFPDLIDKKVKLCLSSKKENGTMASEQDDSEDSKYVKACIKATEAYKKANPKKKSLAKFKSDDEYVNVYKWFTTSEVKHFCTPDGLFGSEMDKGEGSMLQDFIDANDEGLIFDGRTLIVEDLTDAEKKKLGINDYGKTVVTDDEDSYEEPEESEEEEVDEDW
ncbi:hypothetical protein OAE88_00550 [bacterium]|nr:hypothetical protein [bacterium]